MRCRQNWRPRSWVASFRLSGGARVRLQLLRSGRPARTLTFLNGFTVRKGTSTTTSTLAASRL